MKYSLKRFVGLVAVLAMAVSITPTASALSVAPPNQGQLTAVCWENAVYLYWGSHPNANSNSVQKGDSYPNDPNVFWGWLAQGYNGYSYVDHAVVPGVSYSYRVKYRPELASNVVTVTCPVATPTPTPTTTLSIHPNSATIESGSPVTFWATGGTGTYYWEASHSTTSSGWGSSRAFTFYNYSDRTEAYAVTVQSGAQSRTATVWVRPHNTPTPTPYTSLQCYPGRVHVTSGEETVLRAVGYGYSGNLSWSAPSGSPRTGNGATFATRFTNDTNRVKTYTVTVSDGHRTAACDVVVAAYTSPTPTATPYGNELSLVQSGRNISDGQTAYGSTVRADGNETVQFLLTVTNRTGHTLRDVRVTDFLPSGFRYVPDSTTIDGSVVSNGVTTFGLDIGTLRAGRTVRISFSAVVEPSAVPVNGTIIVANTAHVRADDTDVQSSHMNVILGRASYLPAAAGVSTGIGGSATGSLLAAFVVAGMYGLYTRSARFEKRYAFARAHSLAGAGQHPNLLG